MSDARGVIVIPIANNADFCLRNDDKKHYLLLGSDDYEVVKGSDLYCKYCLDYSGMSLSKRGDGFSTYENPYVLLNIIKVMTSSTGTFTETFKDYTLVYDDLVCIKRGEIKALWVEGMLCFV